jgi:hypothetical protein
MGVNCKKNHDQLLDTYFQNNVYIYVYIHKLVEYFCSCVHTSHIHWAAPACQSWGKGMIVALLELSQGLGM